MEEEESPGGHKSLCGNRSECSREQREYQVLQEHMCKVHGSGKRCEVMVKIGILLD